MKQPRPIRIEGDVAYVPLTKGYEAIIDTADVPLVDGVNWCATVHHSAVYAVRTDLISGRPRRVYMHRIIIPCEGLEVDHVDWNGLNNRRNNLRAATTSQNQYNQRLAKHNTSGFKGVSWNKRREKWRAQIRAGGTRLDLGLFPTREDAHAAYAKASAELHGQFSHA